MQWETAHSQITNNESFQSNCYVIQGVEDDHGNLYAHKDREGVCPGAGQEQRICPWKIAALTTCLFVKNFQKTRKQVVIRGDVLTNFKFTMKVESPMTHRCWNHLHLMLAYFCLNFDGWLTNIRLNTVISVWMFKVRVQL